MVEAEATGRDRDEKVVPAAAQGDAACFAPGMEITSNRLIIERPGGSGDNGPPVTITCRDTELATSRARWSPAQPRNPAFRHLGRR